MICEKCDGGIYLHGFSVTKCRICGYKIVTPHTPGGRVCPSCSVTQGLCEQCGEKLEEVPDGEDDLSAGR